MVLVMAVLLGSPWAGGLATTAGDSAAAQLTAGRLLLSLEPAVRDRLPALRPSAERPTTTDPVVRGILAVTMVLIVVGVLALVRATMGSSAHHVTVRVDNQTGLSVQVEALDPAGARVGLGEAEPTAVRTFHDVPDLDVPDLGARWTFVAFYGGREVHRETVARAELAGRDWTVTIPADVTDALEQAGFQ